MTPNEFSAWFRAWRDLPSGDEWWADMASRAMEAQISAQEECVAIPERVASAWANGIMWAAFWLSFGAVVCVSILHFS